MTDYDVTNDWNAAVPTRWKKFLEEWKPKKVLEVGSYEGSTSCFIIDDVPTLSELYCIDTWTGGAEHIASGDDMIAVEARFENNIAIALNKKVERPIVVKLKGNSHKMLSALMHDHEGTFDWIYIDGSHTATDVLTDACLCVHLLRPGGLIVFDDYEWRPGGPSDKPFDAQSPKMAIDSFVATHEPVVDVLEWGYQVFVRKTGRRGQ